MLQSINGALRRRAAAPAAEHRSPPAEPPPRRVAAPVEVVVSELPPRALTVGPLPWYFVAPKLAVYAIHVFMAPFAFLVRICEVLVSITFVTMVAAILAWWFKFIPDSDVATFLSSFGDRIQGILKAVGAF